MFKHSCFIKKNTPELRSKLEKMGYGICPCALGSDGWLFTSKVSAHAAYEEAQDMIEIEGDCVKCDNEDQFLAIAAINGESDMDQWFINGLDWYHCFVDKCPLRYYRKATPSEILEHFK